MINSNNVKPITSFKVLCSFYHACNLSNNTPTFNFSSEYFLTYPLQLFKRLIYHDNHDGDKILVLTKSVALDLFTSLIVNTNLRLKGTMNTL